MEKTDKGSLMVRVPLPRGRVARVPLSVLESYHVEGLTLAHDPSSKQEDVTAHSMSIDPATGMNHWHTDPEMGHCEYVDENGYQHSTVALHYHPFGTEYTEVV